MAVLFKVIKRINLLSVKGKLSEKQVPKVLQGLKQIDSVLQIFDFQTEAMNPQVAELVQKRNQARQKGDWKLADQLRDQLTSIGVLVRDNKTTVR
jgi:cysteinyl-tRNA synthetase